MCRTTTICNIFDVSLLSFWGTFASHNNSVEFEKKKKQITYKPVHTVSYIRVCNL